MQTLASAPTVATAGTILASSAVIYIAAVLVLVGFIWARRVVRGHHFVRRDARAYAIRQQWPAIVAGSIPPKKWRNNALDREVVETILLDSIESATEEALPELLNFLRTSGLLDVRLHEARSSEGWRRRSALVALGRTRAHEAIPPLVDARDSPDTDVRTAAIRGLGAIGSIEAAVPILERMSTGELEPPAAAVSTALVQCCRTQPRRMLTYFHITIGKPRELLARVLSELDLAALGEELISLAQDPSEEVRACAARGLPKLHPSVAIPMLIELAADGCWFVRLRAAVSLGSLDAPDTVNPLLRLLCDENRLVRQRAAAALVRRSDQLSAIVREAVSLGDRLGLQALVSELERCDNTEELLRVLRSRRSNEVADAVDEARRDLEIAPQARQASAP